MTFDCYCNLSDEEEKEEKKEQEEQDNNNSGSLDEPGFAQARPSLTTTVYSGCPH